MASGSLGMVPRLRGASSPLVTATAIVALWTSSPTQMYLCIDRLLSHVALRYGLVLPIRSVTYVTLRIGAGRSIVTSGAGSGSAAGAGWPGPGWTRCADPP